MASINHGSNTLNNSASFTSKDVFAKRKAGDLDEAYQIGFKLVQSLPSDEWNVKALGWCLIDLVKRESQANNFEAVNVYLTQLNNLSFDPSDKIINDQIAFVNNLSNPANKELQKAKKASKDGQHQLAINIYRQVLHEQPDNQEIMMNIGWELYRLAKLQFNSENLNVFAVKKLLNDYLKLNCEKPSLLHSLVLGVADKLTKENNFSLVGFIKVWGIENLRDEDFEKYHDINTGNVYPSLAAKVIQHASKQAVEQSELDLLSKMLPLIDKVLETSEEKIWLELNKARALNLLGDYQSSFELAVNVAKQKVGDYWVWELLGDIQTNLDINKAFNCYCRALSSNPEEKFIANLRLKLARLLTEKGDFSAAKYEVNSVVESRNKEGWAIPEKVNEFLNQPWFDDVVVTKNNDDIYKKFASQAEEVLFQNLPWIKANLGGAFSLPDKPNKKRRKIYLYNSASQFPTEITLPERRFPFNKFSEGMPIQFKGELDPTTNHFTAFQFEERNGSHWDVFSLVVGVVDNVNEDKKLIHVIFDRDVDTVIPFSRLPQKYEVGDSISVKLSKSKTKYGIKYYSVEISSTSEAPSLKIFKPFSEAVRISNELGFTDTDIFIDRNLVDKFNIQDGRTVRGKAILNFNKTRSTWGWKALTIDGVD